MVIAARSRVLALAAELEEVVAAVLPMQPAEMAAFLFLLSVPAAEWAVVL
ncbi:MAG: hypothetical protein AAB650_01685 [Patescibacteria group bacterium]